MRISRVVLPLLLTAALTAPPADAASVNTFTGVLHVDCFGCGPSDATGDLNFLLYGPAQFDGRVVAGGSGTCLASWTLLDGRMVGSRVVDFRLDVVGGVFLFSGQDPVGDIYAGTGVLFGSAVTCGAAVSFTIAGTFASKGG